MTSAKTLNNEGRSRRLVFVPSLAVLLALSKSGEQDGDAETVGEEHSQPEKPGGCSRQANIRQKTAHDRVVMWPMQRPAALPEPIRRPEEKPVASIRKIDCIRMGSPAAPFTSNTLPYP
jgi:hypothetical protein